ncbi:MAG: MerR family transcriptional regulator [Acidimicrobiales bacterium]
MERQPGGQQDGLLGWTGAGGHGPSEGHGEAGGHGPSAGLAPSGEAETGFRGPQVCSIVGITYRQLDYWARTDLLRPSISDARGSGTQRVYSYTDLLQLRVIKQLLDAGVSLRSTRKAIQCLRASGASVASASLVIANDRSVLAHSGEELFDLLRGGQGVLSMVLGMDKIVSEVDAAITDLRAKRAARTVTAGADAEPGTRAAAAAQPAGS